MQVLEGINRRKSFRSYVGDITEEELQKLLKAAQYSPAGRARYDTLKITVVKDKEYMEEINAWSAEFFKSENKQALYGAPVFFVISTIVTGNQFSDNVAYSNAAIVAQDIALEATELNLGSCHIWGAISALAQNKELVKKLNLKEEFIPVCGVVCGKVDYEFVDRNIEDRIDVNYVG